MLLNKEDRTLSHSLLNMMIEWKSLRIEVNHKQTVNQIKYMTLYRKIIIFCGALVLIDFMHYSLTIHAHINSYQFQAVQRTNHIQ